MLIALEFDLVLPIMNNSTMEIQCSEYRDKKVTKIVYTFNKCNVNVN